MTEASAQAPPGFLFPIQLVEVHCATVSAERKSKDEAPGEGAITLGVTALDEAKRAFSARLNVHLLAPGQSDDEVAELRVVVQGSFTSESDISDDLYARYIEFTPVALLWPYARAYVGQAAQMLGLAIPPLPSLDTFGIAKGTEAEATAAAEA